MLTIDSEPDSVDSDNIRKEKDINNVNNNNNSMIYPLISYFLK